MILNDGTITLRAVEPSDLDTLYLWENDTSLWNVSLTTAPLSRQQLWEYINSYDADIYNSKQLRFIIDCNGVSIGTVDIFDFDAQHRRAFIGIFIAAQYRRNGFAFRALSLIEEYSHKIIGMHQLSAIVSVENAPSLSLFKAQGFTTSGRLRSWLRSGNSYTDAIILQKLFN